MKKHIKYPKTPQLSQVVRTIKSQAQFVGLDENGDAIYDGTLPLPTLTFTGTIKLHGTNAGVSYNYLKDIWYQSRENIITVNNDNAGFAAFCEKNKELLKQMILEVAKLHQIDLNTNTITMYGEWAGGNIQSGVALSQLPKRFYIFAVKVAPFDEDSHSYWIDDIDLEVLRDRDNEIYNIEDFDTYAVTVDFNQPELSQNKFIEITDMVEKECPIGRYFGVSGICEGVVWTAKYKDVVYRFKVKGQAHSSSKVKKTASVDLEKLNSVNEFVEYAVTENRFQQGLGIVFPDGELDIKKMGDIIRWVMNDVIDEETDTLVNSGLAKKDIGKALSVKVRSMFLTAFNKL